MYLLGEGQRDVLCMTLIYLPYVLLNSVTHLLRGFGRGCLMLRKPNFVIEYKTHIHPGNKAEGYAITQYPIHTFGMHSNLYQEDLVHTHTHLFYMQHCRVMGIS